MIRPYDQPFYDPQALRRIGQLGLIIEIFKEPMSMTWGTCFIEDHRGRRVATRKTLIVDQIYEAMLFSPDDAALLLDYCGQDTAPGQTSTRISQEIAVKTIRFLKEIY